MAGFVCIYYGNTGSTWLLSALGGSPQVLVPGFEPVEDWAWRVSGAERVEWLRTALAAPVDRDGSAYQAWVEKIRESPQVNEVPSKPLFQQVGFKMSDLAVYLTQDVADALYDVNAKVIVLTRENRIKHALSMYRYQEEGKSQFSQNGSQQGSHSSSRVRLWTFHRWLRESQRRHREVLRTRETLVRLLGSDHVLDLSYEQFIVEEGKRHTLHLVTGFLDIGPIELAHDPMVKATPDDLRSAVANYSALRARYSFTSFSRYFEE